eukprot:353758-Chlamydomonas_euryale.AAC.9
MMLIAKVWGGSKRGEDWTGKVWASRTAYRLQMMLIAKGHGSRWEGWVGKRVAAGVPAADDAHCRGGDRTAP